MGPEKIVVIMLTQDLSQLPSFWAIARKKKKQVLPCSQQVNHGETFFRNPIKAG